MSFRKLSSIRRGLLILILMLADSVESLVHRCHAPISSATGPWRQRCDTSHCHARASILQNYVHSTSLRLSSPLNNNEPLVQIPVTTSTVGTNRQLRKKELQTIQRWLEIESWKRADLRGLEPVLQSVAEACKQISRIVQRAQTDDVYGVAVDVNGNPLEDTNIQGEVQQKLDVLCNIIMMRAFCGSSRHIRSVASEEEDEPRCCSDIMRDDAFAVGDFVAVFDPLDGSKNIDASLPVGSIFGIYRTVPGQPVTNDSFLCDGSSLVAAGYCLYSATTILVLTLGSGVDGFTLDPDVGRFLHTHKDIRIPARGLIYSFNEANFNDYDEPVKKYLNSMKDFQNAKGQRSSARYIGSMVADIHNVLINGGIYGYPSTFSNKQGKIRLLYEAAPMAFIIEQAGGAGSTGRKRILNIVPGDTHQRVPVFLGSIENVYELDQFFQYYSDDIDYQKPSVADD